MVFLRKILQRKTDSNMDELGGGGGGGVCVCGGGGGGVVCKFLDICEII